MPTLKATVREIVANAAHPLTADEIIERVRVGDEGPKRSSIRAELGRLVQNGIVLNLNGQGHPGLYTKGSS